MSRRLSQLAVFAGILCTVFSRPSQVSQGIPDFGMNRDFAFKAVGTGHLIRDLINDPYGPGKRSAAPLPPAQYGLFMALPRDLAQRWGQRDYDA